MRKLMVAAAVSFGLTAVAQTVSVKSPDGKNEIRLDTEPVLSYSVFRSGIERIASTPLAMSLEGKGLLGGAKVKISSIDTQSLKGKVETPLYKKSSVDETANKAVVSFAGNWRIALIARNDGVAYRFETGYAGRVKVLDETVGISFHR